MKETKCEDIFTPEDFSEEQNMMKEAVMEFNDREIIPTKQRFEAKDYALTEEVMRKAGELGFLRCCCSRSLWWIRNGLCFYLINL